MMRKITFELPVIKPERLDSSIDVTPIRFYDKKAPYYEFSNYYPHPITLDDVTYPTSENYYQSQKFVYEGASPESIAYSKIVAQANTPNKSRILALQKTGGGYKWRTDLNPLIKEYKDRGATINPNWDRVRDNVMRRVVYAKFSHSPLKETLLETYPRELIEASPRDNYWGEGKLKTGKNLLGKILEEVRFILRITNKLPIDPIPSPYRKAQWVIPGILIASSYIESEEVTEKLLIGGGVTVFVDLVDAKQRKKLNLYPYYESSIFRQHYVSFPIEDRKIEDDLETLKIATLISSLISEGEIVAVHCLGGKGRTGVIIALVLWMIYGMNAEDVLYFTEKNFQLREDKGKRCPHSPQTKVQKNQVKRIIARFS